MNQERIMNIVLVAILVAIVYLIYTKNRTPGGTQSEKMLKELYSIKDALIPKKYIEKYRSNGNNGLTIIGTAMEQMVDIMIAILKQKPTQEIVDSFVRESVDATTIAEAIETVGKEIVKEISQNDVLETKEVIGKVLNKQGEVIEERKRTIYRPKREAMQTIARNVGKNGVLKVLEDESKYDKYYDATKNIILDIDRKTNPDATDERFPTKEVFKSEAMPRLIEEIKGNLERV
jgi:hypothetical protein